MTTKSACQPDTFPVFGQRGALSRRWFALWIGLLIAAPPQANGAIINKIFEADAQLTSGFSSDGSAHADEYFTVDQFDPALGTLFGLRIRTFGGTAANSLVFIRNTDTNNSHAFLGNVSLDISVDGSVITPFSHSLTDPTDWYGFTTEVSAGGAFFDFINDGTGVDEEFTDAVTLGHFTGIGSIPYHATFSTSTQQTGGDLGYFDYAPDLNVSAGLNVTYYYDEPSPAPAETPEPSTMVMALTGIVFAGGRAAWRKRSIKQSA